MLDLAILFFPKKGRCHRFGVVFISVRVYSFSIARYRRLRAALVHSVFCSMLYEEINLCSSLATEMLNYFQSCDSDNFAMHSIAADNINENATRRKQFALTGNKFTKLC